MYTDTTPSPSGTTEVTLRRCRALRHNSRPIRQISTAAAAAAQRPHQNTVAAVDARNCCPVHSWWGNLSRPQLVGQRQTHAEIRVQVQQVPRLVAERTASRPDAG